MNCIRSVPPHIAALKPYEAGLTPEDVRERFGIENAIKLASNENPLGTSPKAIEFACRSLSDMARYPDSGLALRRRLADEFNTKLGNVIVGSGSEGIMANIVRTFLLDDDEILTTEAAFLGFQVLARGRGVHYRTVPYRNWTYDLPAIADAINDRTKLIYLANPNNPTGTYFTRSEFERFYAKVPDRVLIILDEAYFEYAAECPDFPDSMNYRFDNVITLRTFSKAYGLAAARVGYGFAHEDLITMLLKVKLSFEPSGASAAAALGALEDEAFLRMSVESNRTQLAYVSEALRALGHRVVPSAANFVMVVTETASQADRLFNDLLREGVIVRPLKATGIPNALRISIGIPEENRRLVSAVSTARIPVLASA
ncbi:MAG: aminotransferase [Bryobacterales bacterium]|jgi:histidinol-phosphate aminotransferase|nr:aminotransferase [Bryobacterales bacterium]